jgi:hypothetical protein
MQTTLLKGLGPRAKWFHAEILWLASHVMLMLMLMLLCDAVLLLKLQTSSSLAWVPKAADAQLHFSKCAKQVHPSERRRAANALLGDLAACPHAKAQLQRTWRHASR